MGISRSFVGNCYFYGENEVWKKMGILMFYIKMVYIYFMKKKKYKFKICLVKNRVHLFLRRSSTGIRTVYGSHLPNLICIWFIECFFRCGTLVDFLMVRVFYLFFVWVFMNIDPCLLLLVKFLVVFFLVLILIFVYCTSR